MNYSMPHPKTDVGERTLKFQPDDQTHGLCIKHTQFFAKQELALDATILGYEDPSFRTNILAKSATRYL